MQKFQKLLHIGLALMVTLCVSASAQVKVGQAAPEFAVKGLDGKSVTLKSLQGKPVVLEWINPECPVSHGKYEDNTMQGLQKKYAKDVIWISIASSAKGKEGFHSTAEWKEILKKLKALPNYLVVDADGKIGRTYGAKTTPHMFVIDKNGKLAYQGAIDDKKETNYVDAALKALVAGKKPEKTTVQAYGCFIKY